MQRYGVGPRLSQAVAHGDMLFISGQISSRPETGIAEQTCEILNAIEALLKEGGTSKSRLVSVDIFLPTSPISPP